jgi:hypothetical protein
LTDYHPSTYTASSTCHPRRKPHQTASSSYSTVPSSAVTDFVDPDSAVHFGMSILPSSIRVIDHAGLSFFLLSPVPSFGHNCSSQLATKISKWGEEPPLSPSRKRISHDWTDRRPAILLGQTKTRLRSRLVLDLATPGVNGVDADGR